MFGRRIASGLAGLAIAAIAGTARADGKVTLSGQWTASALGESWSVSEWGAACGPKPAGQGAGGGSVQIREQGGELSIIGAGRAFSTAECWEQMPGLGRTSHSSSGGGRFWRTRCTSAPNDPRRAAVTTSISATDSSIQLSETGEYQFIIKDTTCRASVTRSRSFSLVRREGDTPPAPSTSASASASAPPSAAPVASAAPPAKSPPSGKCGGPAGEPARLEVQPGKKLLRSGDRFTFKAIVTDADGCATGTKPTWSILPGPLADKASIDATGTLSLADDAGEGRLEVSAAVGAKGVSVLVDVARPDNYDALLAARGLDDAGEGEQAAVAVIAVGSIGGRTSVAEDLARERKSRFVAIVAGVAVLLGFAGLVIARRGRRRAPAPEPEPAPSLPRPPSPTDVQPEPAAIQPVPAPPVPAPPAPLRGKICPTCGEQYPNEAEFCGKDATQLVLIN